MRIVKLNRLLLENFKCHRYLNLVFNGGSASIYGDNAAGKTSVYDALTWLLFGKDSKGNGEKNIDIKPLNTAGDVADHSAITAVEAEFAVDGESIAFRRTYKEIWTTRRGSSEEVYDGNSSEYFVDGVPMKKYAYDDKIKELVPEETFRLLTSVSYFASDLKWQNRRGILFDMAGTKTDREIMAMDARFEQLLDGMGKLSLEDYRKKLTSERRGFTGIKDQTPARLDECQKSVRDLSGLDYAGARETIADMEKHQREITAQMVSLDHDRAADSKRLEIREAELERKRLEAENAAFRDRQMSGAPDLAGLRRQRAALVNRLANAQALLSSAEKMTASQERSINESRARWVSVNSEAFTGGTCPTCGQQLPFEQLQAATGAFEQQKKKRLDEIMRTANSQMEAKAQAENQAKSLREEIDALEKEIQQADASIVAAESAQVVPADMDGYAESAKRIRDRITALNGELSAMMGSKSDAREHLRQELTAVQSAISEAQVILGKESVLAYSKRRMEEIQAEARNAAEALERIDQMLYLTDEYTRYKTQFVENGVNCLFRIARFRLFREQANGGVEERCDVVYNGVPYMGLNNGMKINVGVDIINALSRHYGVAVPLFVDNAESVTHLEAACGQVIRLVVSESDKELRLVNEG